MVTIGVQQVLQNLHFRNADSDWLQQCVQYVQGNGGDFENDLCYQIMNSNLEDICDSSVLGNLNIDGHIEMDWFLAQIVDIYEIGVSAYQMLDELKEKKPFTRKILKFILSDGVQRFVGLETKLLSGIDLCSPLGSKVLVCGKIKRGVLMLNEENFKFLGGTVFEMNEEPVLHRLENKFRSVLKMPLINLAENPKEPVADSDHYFDDNEALIVGNGPERLGNPTSLNEYEGLFDEDLELDNLSIQNLAEEQVFDDELNNVAIASSLNTSTTQPIFDIIESDLDDCGDSIDLDYFDDYENRN
jgi:hypothetical protein